MDWEVVQAISSIVASVAVVLTVVYVAIQVRRSTVATYSQTYQFATQALGEMAAIVGHNKETSRIFTVGMATPEKLDNDEFIQFSYLGISLFRRYENVFFQYQSGMIDEDFWAGHRDNVLWFYHRPGTQRWWQERRLSFSKRFREFLESTSPDEVAAPSTRQV
ncbi:MAG: hypothetical protein Q8P46_13270 [Hyphomicrobiales bacterium]|nr:hypothetical protein [Hyphomicrobiales bacterium]